MKIRVAVGTPDCIRFRAVRRDDFVGRDEAWKRIEENHRIQGTV